MTIETYFAYLAVCAVAVVIPGPTNTLILANGMRHGVRAGLLNVAGTQAGLAVMIAVVGFGLTSVIEIAGHWFEWIKLLGAAYLVWIGWQMIRKSGGESETEAAGPPRGGFFTQGLLVALGNPKQLLFFGALLPQFVSPSGNHMVQIAILGATALLLAVVSDGAYALASARLGRGLSAAKVRLVSRLGGGMLIGGGLWLAFSRTK
ncbi:LysE family translocator [Aquamicrobium sp. LC103]|uniref:LysE family translocator n=1 Tax=Aquamicrobium sp. LC103 TaxID=1120658 RepID=UPI00063E81E4|nr:LysE family translocator [Aquamicrobium sp. LC103]TKT82646.1 LysE family translocator [Aquamicrobium sp. LC103]